MGKVIAVVVTYNRCQLLSKCISALNNQTRKPDAILVVNNGSTDNTKEWLNDQVEIFYINQENEGSAGGFKTGIKWAYDNGYTWIWCMDDDGYPHICALENLLLADDGTLRLMNCSVLDIDNKETFVWNTKNYTSHSNVKEKIIEGVGHPFNGTLLHRKIVERVGLPDAKYFLWGDETEYYYRITRKNKIPVCTVTDSIHYHPSSRFSIKADWNHVNSWKMYFYVRNRNAVLQAKFNNRLKSFLYYCCFILAFAGVIIIFQKTDRLKKLRFMFWPVKHAFTNQFVTTPSSVINKLLPKSTSSKLQNAKLAGI